MAVAGGDNVGVSTYAQTTGGRDGSQDLLAVDLDSAVITEDYVVAVTGVDRVVFSTTQDDIVRRSSGNHIFSVIVVVADIAAGVNQFSRVKSSLVTCGEC